MIKNIIKSIRTFSTVLAAIFYVLIGIVNIVVLLAAIMIKFKVGLLLALIVSIFIGYIPVIGSAFTVWGGCVWLGLNILQSLFFFMALPLIITIILGLLMGNGEE